MKSYVHDPQLFRRHFAGKALPAFQGKRIQRGNGLMFSFAKRLAVPLLQAVAPHIAKTASALATRAVSKVFPRHKRMQRIVGDVVRVGANAAVSQVQKQKRKANASSVGKKSARATTTAAKRAKRRGRRITTKRNIFAE